MQRKRAPSRFLPVAAAALGISLAGSCKNADTIAGPSAAASSPSTQARWTTHMSPTPTRSATPTRTPTATPTPGPPPPTPKPGTIAGAWTGTFDPMDFVDCDPGGAASATFTQTGTVVTGDLTADNPCGFTDVQLRGTLVGATLTGTVTGGRFHHGTASGVLTDTTLEITLTSQCPGDLCIPGGYMHLHR